MPQAAPNLRQLSGLQLKNTIKDLKYSGLLPPILVLYTQQNVLDLLIDPSRECQRIAAQIITTLVSGGTLVRYRFPRSRMLVEFS